MRNPFTRFRFIWLTAAIVLFTVAMAYIDTESQAEAFHTEAELEAFALRSANDLPIGGNELFKASGECAGCHGPDVTGFAMVDAEGNDVNVTSTWRATMMANAARDPFWRAKVSHEVLVNPNHQVELEDKCTACHAPQGNYNDKYLGNPHYSIAEMLEDPTAMDGVACVACHQQSPDSLGQLFSGHLKYETQVVYGPYDAPPAIFASPMLAWVQLDPQYGAHVEQGTFCAGCHTLLTETVDLDGEFTGGEFVEQATYHEWVNSIYEETNSCQSCHMPRIDDPVVISSGYTFLEGRSPFGKHHLVGGNSFMLKLLKENITELGLTATEAQFDSVIARTRELLQNETLALELSEVSRDSDTARYALNMINKVGHKFPSGYPARLAFIEFIVTDENADTLFASGLLDEDYNIVNRDEGFESHYDLITSEGQVQIYEMVMADVNGDVTTVLERAAYPLKDNRLVPVGFSTLHPSYDTTLIAGAALNDPNFNYENGEEGSGTDEIRYHIPMYGYTGDLNVSAKVYYQSVPRRWLDEMFAYESDEIDLFRDMYNAADHTPELVAEVSIEDVVTAISEPLAVQKVKAYPTPTTDGYITIELPESDRMQVTMFDMSGKALFDGSMIVNQRFEFVVPDQKGVYIIRLASEKAVYVTRVVKQ